MTNSTSVRAVTFILREILGEVLYFPVWWFSIGFATFLQALWHGWLGVAERLAIRILLKNMFRPMYADYTRSGRVISFFFRIFLVAVRLVVLAVWTAIDLVLIVGWLVVPLLAAAMLVRNIFWL